MIYRDKRNPRAFMIKRYGIHMGCTVGNHAEYLDNLATLFRRLGFSWSSSDDDELLGKLEVPKEFLE